jgi:hypothetical protein
MLAELPFIFGAFRSASLSDSLRVGLRFVVEKVIVRRTVLVEFVVESKSFNEKDKSKESLRSYTLTVSLQSFQDRWKFHN